MSATCHLQATARKKLLQKLISDHFPICLVFYGIKWGHIPFKFDKWLKVNGLSDKVNDWWRVTVTRKGKLQSYPKDEGCKIWSQEAQGRGKKRRYEYSTFTTGYRGNYRRESEGDMSIEDLIRRESLKFELATMYVWKKFLGDGNWQKGG